MSYFGNCFHPRKSYYVIRSVILSQRLSILMFFLSSVYYLQQSVKTKLSLVFHQQLRDVKSVKENCDVPINYIKKYSRKIILTSDFILKMSEKTMRDEISKNTIYGIVKLLCLVFFQRKRNE